MMPATSTAKRVNLRLLQEEHAELVRKLLNQNHFPLVLGGGHEIAFGNFSGLFPASPGPWTRRPYRDHKFRCPL